MLAENAASESEFQLSLYPAYFLLIKSLFHQRWDTNAPWLVSILW